MSATAGDFAMFKDIIPGHVRAYTLWACALFCICTFFGYWLLVGGEFLESLIKAIGVAILIFGMFLADQATHLHQMNHRGIRLTWIEEQMQAHRYLFVGFGFVTTAFGIVILLIV